MRRFETDGLEVTQNCGYFQVVVAKCIQIGDTVANPLVWGVGVFIKPTLGGRRVQWI